MNFKPLSLYLTIPWINIYTIVIQLYLCCFIFPKLSIKKKIFTIILFKYILTQNTKNYTSFVYYILKSFPIISTLLKKELSKIRSDLQKDELSYKTNDRTLTIPNKKSDDDDIILSQLSNNVRDNLIISGGIYAPTELDNFKVRVYEKVVTVNPMHTDLWPQIQDKEAVSIEMCLNLYNASNSGWGVITSGGTMSIYTACLTYREKFKDKFNAITNPEILVSEKAHPAFKKAAHILQLKHITIPVDDTYKMDIKKLKQKITKNTIMIVASAPAFPEGIIDDIETIATIAKSYNIPCHVDACLGGFLLPFAKDINLDIPSYDFTVKGITSISADFHKYGMSEKGHSAIMFLDFDNYGKYSTFIDLNSSIGMYVSLGLEGSRPARIDAWATMLKVGKETYINNLKKMVNMKREIVKGVKSIVGIEVSGKPLLPIFAIRSVGDSINIMLIASKMKEKNWIINGLPDPPGFHFCITPVHISNKTFVEDFIRDLEWSTKYAKNNINEKPSGQLGMYDTIRDKLPNNRLKKFILEDIGHSYLNIISSAKQKYPILE
jgi:sphinganine-1-phosphate aldolase